MKAVIVEQPGDASALRISEVEAPRVGAGQLLVRVAGAALNRADLMQRMGLYPPPPGASEVLGLECSGVVERIGDGVAGWQVGDRVMALLAGGGYAELAVVDAGSAMRAPDRLDLVEAACFPEVFLTAHLNLFDLAGAEKGDSVLVHGGGSGVGTAAIQLCNEAGVDVIVTAGSDEKCKRCVDLGATAAINYRDEEFPSRVREITAERGVDVILDPIGGQYLKGNLESLAVGGRLVLIGLMGGMESEINLASVLMRRLSVIGSTLRSRSVADKATIVRRFLDRFGDALEAGRIRPIVDRVFPIEEVAEAHRLMESSRHFGKIALRL